MSRIGIVYHSATGTTAQLARAVASGVMQVAGAVPHTFRITGEDIRAGRYMNSAGLDELAGMDGLIFGSPTYMGSVSAQFKAFADATGEIWARRGWADKVGAAFTIGSNLNGDQYSTVSYLKTFASQHGMLWVSLDVPGGYETTVPNRLGAQGGLVAQTREGSVHEADLATAAYLGSRVARLANLSAAWREEVCYAS
jgi:multimeric flavodoxin WrbA